MTAGQPGGTITRIPKVRAYIIGMAEGEDVYVNGKDNKFTLIEREGRADGTVYCRFQSIGTEYECSIDPSGEEAVVLEQVGGDSFVVLNIEDPNGGAFINSDVRAEQYLDDVR